MERLGLVVLCLAHAKNRPFYMQSKEGSETAAGFTRYMLSTILNITFQMGHIIHVSKVAEEINFIKTALRLAIIR
jgi:TRAP-type mannitol/chloroaromatic compound transport system permease small subunit